MPHVRPRSTARRGGALGLLAALVLAASPAGAESLRLFSVGTASLSGNYYAVGRALCRAINSAGPSGLRCSPEPTPGSLYNLLALRAGELEFAFVQSDWQHRAVNGEGPFAGAPMDELRSVMSLYAEAVTLVVRADAGIARVEDLAGKIVDLGSPSTARRATNERVLAGIGVDTGGFAETVGLSGTAVETELCAGRTDASVIVVGHPSATLGDWIARCDLRLVPLDGRAVARFVEQSSDFGDYTIPAGLYLASADRVETVSTMATLVTRADVPNELVGYVARTLIDGWESLARDAPVLGARDMGRMRSDGLSAPLHPAAESAFEEVGEGAASDANN